MTTRADFAWAPSPYTFLRRYCAFCDDLAVTHIAHEPVCRVHAERVQAIQRSAIAAEREREQRA